MHRKLVKLDGSKGWNFAEVDSARVIREAKLVRDIVQRDVPANDPYGIHSELLPLIERVIQHTQQLPLDSQFEPGALRWARHEDTLPPSYHDFIRAEASFWVSATGTHRDAPVEELINGERYAWMEFED